PLFSPDGKLIYFLSSREKGKKLWALPLAGGEPYEIKTFDNGLSNLQWLSDSTLTFVASEGKTLYETELETKKDFVEVVEDTAHFKPTRIFSFNLKNKTIKRLTDNHYPVGGYAVSKDGNWLVSSHIRSPHYGADAQPAPEYFLWNLPTGQKTKLFEQGYQTPGNFAFTADHRGFYFTSQQSSDPQWNGAGISLLHYYDLATRTALPVPLAWEWGLSDLEVWGNHALVALANGPTNTLALLEKAPNANTWAKRGLSAGAMTEHVRLLKLADRGNQLIFSYSTPSVPPQVHVGKLVVEAKKNQATLQTDGELVTLNPGFKTKTKAKTEVMRWAGWKNEEVTGILYYPHNYQPGRAYPLVLSIHGGPAGADLDEWGESWASYPNLLAQKGAFVLQPNYHGSSNHGLAFMESIKKNYYDPEMEDITKGVNVLIEKGLAHRDSLGVMGWSNGAILTTMLTVRYPDLFKVAAPGAGDVNWTSDFGTCQFGVSFDQSYFGGAPWDDLGGKNYNEAYITKSPLFELEKVKTPTIIFHGSEDRQVPRDQGHEYYRALQQVGKAPVRFLWFPGAYHGLAKLTHQLRKMNEEIAWFDKYLFKKEKPENEAFKRNSPLAELLKRDSLASQNGQLGLLVNNLLVPETVPVKKDSIALGRFEVTNAQYRAHAPAHAYPSGHDNHPATGLSLAQAQAYVQWLSEKTGAKYRLPNEREAKALHAQAKTAAASENTLAYWAGYTPTVDELPALRQKMAEAKSSLLKAGGSFKPTKAGAAELYDLGGNAAEYHLKADGTAGTYGYAAPQLADATQETPPPPAPAYVGWRVVKEK
nr:prolyl oligopeptidase family serine peptidase [Bernardetiaceae bacterium]